MILSSLFLIASGVYAIFMIFIALGNILNQTHQSNDLQPISVVIAAKNEAKNLPTLLDSLRKLNYPPELYEIIIVDDGSTDNSHEILQTCSRYIKYLRFDNTETDLIGKKAAITYGITYATHDILAFTDADCVLPATWLKTISKYFNPDTDYMLGYSIVTWDHRRECTQKNFERSIYYALATAGMYWKHPITSSACNMVYRKSVFMKSGGFAGIGHIRSGDDDLLLMKIFPQIRKARLCTAPDMCITTLEADSSEKRHSAGIRRASKFRYFPLWLRFTAFFVFLYLISAYAMFVTGLFEGFGELVIIGLAIKTASEILMLAIFQMRVKQLKLLLLYPLELFAYPLRFVYFAVRGTLGNYKWK